MLYPGIEDSRATYTHYEQDGRHITICYIVRNGNRLAVGIAICNDQDIYKRQFGNRIALARAYKAYYKGVNSNPIRPELRRIAPYTHKCVCLDKPVKPKVALEAIAIGQ